MPQFVRASASGSKTVAGQRFSDETEFSPLLARRAARRRERPDRRLGHSSTFTQFLSTRSLLCKPRRAAGSETCAASPVRRAPKFREVPAPLGFSIHCAELKPPVRACLQVMLSFHRWFEIIERGLHAFHGISR